MNLYRFHPPTSSLFPKLYSLTTILRVISISALTSNLEAGLGCIWSGCIASMTALCHFLEEA